MADKTRVLNNINVLSLFDGMPNLKDSQKIWLKNILIEFVEIAVVQ